MTRGIRLCAASALLVYSHLHGPGVGITPTMAFVDPPSSCRTIPTRSFSSLATHHRVVPAATTTSRTTFTTTSSTTTAPSSSSSSSMMLSSSSVQEQAASWKAQAEQIRLEAEKMDASLTLEKIETIERKLTDPHWLKRHPEEEARLRQQLSDLNNRLQGKPPMRRVLLDETESPPSMQRMGLDDDANNNSRKPNVDSRKSDTPSNTPATCPPNRQTSSSSSGGVNSIVNSSTKCSTSASSATTNEECLEGFSSEDLELYIPVAEMIEQRLKTATPLEKLEAFRSAPELQDHFQDKIQQLLVGPMEDMQRVASLKQQYLDSNSSKEKDQLKRQIDRLEKSMEDDGPFAYSESVYRPIPDLSEEDIEKRVHAIEKLPGVLQSLYKKRQEVDDDGDIRLAILLEHYESQLQLLDQVRHLDPFTDESRSEAIQGYNSLPQAVRDHFAKQVGLKAGSDAEAVVKELGGLDERSWGPAIPFQPIVEVTTTTELPVYSDIEFIDRSRFAEELIPGFARMEEVGPTEEEIESFCSDILDKKTFSLTSKPDRVMGGYYLRGENRIQGDGANDLLVERLQERLSQSSLDGQLQFFFIPDPTAPTEEELEMGTEDTPILAVTSVDPTIFYQLTSPLTKSMVTLSGFLSSVVYSLGACGLNTGTFDRLQSAADTGATDVSFLTDMLVPTATTLIGIQVVHELAHRVVAWKHGFEIGLPNFVPSIQTGLAGAITPIKTAPKNFNSLFDFAIAGPMAGFFLSFGLLFVGVTMTASMDMISVNDLPALPVLFLRSSALGGEIIEYFLGNGVLTSAAPETTVVPLHPFAVAGYAGLLINALALLPLGTTDGGRMALAMFGRRGAFLVKTFATLAICAVGLFGFDRSEILLLYALFVVLWQRELEGPVRNEVDELDISRGFLGIASLVLAALTLIPLP